MLLSGLEPQEERDASTLVDLRQASEGRVRENSVPFPLEMHGCGRRERERKRDCVLRDRRRGRGDVESSGGRASREMRLRSRFGSPTELDGPMIGSLHFLFHAFSLVRVRSRDRSREEKKPEGGKVDDGGASSSRVLLLLLTLQLSFLPPHLCIDSRFHKISRSCRSGSCFRRLLWTEWRTEELLYSSLIQAPSQILQLLWIDQALQIDRMDSRCGWE